MKRKRIVITVYLILAVTVCSAQSGLFKNLSIGVSGGYADCRTFTPEIFVQKNLTLFNRPFEPKVGINFRNVESSFQGVGHLETNSIGLFGEATVFPFRKYFFAGVRWELITFNRLTGHAMKELNSNLSSITLKEKFPLFYIYPGILTQYQTCNSNINCFENQSEIMEYLIEQYRKYGINSSLEYHSLIKSLVPCMAECSNTDMIGPKGEMYLCLKDVGDEKEIIGNIYTGKTNISLISEYCMGTILSLNKECRNCKVRWLCGCGCPNHRYRNKQYGEQHDICNPIKNSTLLNKLLDIHYESKKNRYE